MCVFFEGGNGQTFIRPKKDYGKTGVLFLAVNIIMDGRTVEPHQFMFVRSVRCHLQSISRPSPTFCMFNAVTEDTDVEELLDLVISVGRSVQENSRVLETMSELVKKVKCYRFM